MNLTQNNSISFNLKNHSLDSITMFVSSLICVVASVLYFFLIKKKTSGLNVIIKSILYFMAGGSFLSNLITSINGILMFFWHLKNFTTCTMNRVSLTANNFSILVSLALISQVRYYIAVKTSQIRAYKKKTLKYIIATELVELSHSY